MPVPHPTVRSLLTPVCHRSRPLTDGTPVSITAPQKTKSLMTITLFQRDILWADPSANIRLNEQLLLDAPKSDLYVLPEMWSTGFVTSPAEAHIADGATELQWMQQMAKRLDAAIAGSVAIQAEDGTYRNRFYFVTPEHTTHYDKHHLFTYGGEHKRYTAGQERVVAEWRGVRFLLMVCYDLRFPTYSRNIPREEGGYDCALYVASWPTPRVEAWRTLLLARAIENQCYVCGVNRVGTDPTCQYCGGTAAIDPYGKYIEACPDGAEGTITFTLDLDALQAFREKFPVLKDRDYIQVKN